MYGVDSKYNPTIERNTVSVPNFFQRKYKAVPTSAVTTKSIGGSTNEYPKKCVSFSIPRVTPHSNLKSYRAVTTSVDTAAAAPLILRWPLVTAIARMRTDRPEG
jgi:hypothetical protein